MAVSELQLGLIALGASAVVAVIGYNAWQARRHKQLAERLVAGTSGDVLLAPRAAAPAAEDAVDERVEPRLMFDAAVAGVPLADDAAAAPADGELPSAAGLAEPLLADEAPPPPPPALPSELLSPICDYIAALETIEAVPGEEILAIEGEVLRAIGKRVAWVGLAEASNAWELCRPAASYRGLRIGVQLADRRGPLGESQLEDFRGAVQRLAEAIAAVADLPQRRPALENAQRLDRICAGVDIQVGVNVVCDGAPFPGTKIRALAEAAGMVIEADGAYVRRDDEKGCLLYTLRPLGDEVFSVDGMRTLSTKGLTFLLDVPCVAGGDRVFNQMVEVARRFAETLHGQLVDDNRRPITEQFLAPIRAQITQYQKTMASHGLPPGGDIALRLFS
jgi:FtsZ-interacting cell division protein ZipA